MNSVHDAQMKCAIITGGSGTIGSIASKAFLSVAMKVVSLSRRGNPPQGFKDENTDLIHCVKCDVSDEKKVSATIAEISSQWNEIDILVNAAGIQGPFGIFEETKPEEWKRNYEVNVYGTYIMTRAVLPFMGKQRRGKIINLSGGGSTASRPRLSAYASSKAAVVRFTETIADELRASNRPIDVNAIAPGAVNSFMTKEILENRELAGEKEFADATKTQKTGGTDPALLTEFFLFFASEHSDGISGKLISALWDDWKNFPQQVVPLQKSSLYTLRRIDSKSFYEKKK